MTKVHNIEKGEVLSLVVVNERLGASLPRIGNIVMEKNVEDVDRPRLCVKAASCRRLGGEGYSSVVAHARSGSGIRAHARSSKFPWAAVMQVVLQDVENGAGPGSQQLFMLWAAINYA